LPNEFPTPPGLSFMPTTLSGAAGWLAHVRQFGPPPPNVPPLPVAPPLPGVG